MTFQKNPAKIAHFQQLPKITFSQFSTPESEWSPHLNLLSGYLPTSVEGAITRCICKKGIACIC